MKHNRHIERNLGLVVCMHSRVTKPKRPTITRTWEGAKLVLTLAGVVKVTLPVDASAEQIMQAHDLLMEITES
jgi:hypothetical protein